MVVFLDAVLGFLEAAQARSAWEAAENCSRVSKGTRAERRLAQIIGLDCTVPSTAWNRFSSGAFWAGFVRYISRLGAPGSRCSALTAATCR